MHVVKVCNPRHANFHVRTSVRRDYWLVRDTTSINPIIYELRLNVEFSHIEKANNTFLQAGNLRVHARRPTNSAGFCKFKIEYSSQHPAEIFASCRNICILPNSLIRQRCNTTLWKRKLDPFFKRNAGLWHFHCYVVAFTNVSNAVVTQFRALLLICTRFRRYDCYQYLCNLIQRKLPSVGFSPTNNQILLLVNSCFIPYFCTFQFIRIWIFR